MSPQLALAALLLLAAPTAVAAPILDAAVPETRECELCWVTNVVIPILDAARHWAQDPPVHPPGSPPDSGGQLQ